ncbi:MAG: sugar-binding protein [Armatimonadota bacterium]|jgi:hypothetical protein
MINLKTSLLMLLFIAITGLCAAGEQKVYTAYKLSHPIMLDGTISSSAWQQTIEAVGFKILGSKSKGLATKQTGFRIAWDEEALYVAVRCEEPDMPKIQSKRKDGEALWGDDSIEIFLCPKYPAYDQLIVNTIGSKTWVNAVRNWAVAASRTQDSWTAEIRIPFAELGAVPKDGDTWRFNIARNILTYDSGGERFSAWADVLTRFAEVENFAYLRFSKLTISPDKAAAANCESRMAIMRPAQESADLLLKKCSGKIENLKKYYPEKANDPNIYAFLQEIISTRKLLDADIGSYSQVQFLCNKARNLAERITAFEIKLLLE